MNVRAATPTEDGLALPCGDALLSAVGNAPLTGTSTAGAAPVDRAARRPGGAGRTGPYLARCRHCAELARECGPGGGAPASPQVASSGHLGWAFTLLNWLRVASYLPTMWAIHASGDSSQHSLWTWCIWLGANATMAAWVHEHNGRRTDRAVVVTLCNAAMCAATILLILAQRLWTS